MRTLPTCPDLCQNPHNEQPGDVIHHYWPAADFPQADNGRPLTVFYGFYDHDMRIRLEIGGHSLDLAGAEALIRHLNVALPRMQALQAELGVNAELDRILDHYQVVA